MSPAADRPREQQVRLLTAGVRLPLVALEDDHLAVIAETIERAWKSLLKSTAGSVLELDEAEINAMMATRLNRILDEDARWETLVASVVRGREMTSFDGSSLEKRPDLSIQLTGRNPDFPLVVECKLIDTGSDKRVRLYCRDGLSRFLSGEYAWPSREAMMVAYVRDGSTIPSSLTPFLSKSRRDTPDPFTTEQLPEPLQDCPQDLARSRHGRRFLYLHRSPPNEPGSIAIWHLWLGSQPRCDIPEPI